jgi:hypothetical protein
MTNENKFSRQTQKAIRFLPAASCCLAFAAWLSVACSLPVPFAAKSILLAILWSSSVLAGVGALLLIRYRYPGMKGKSLAIAAILLSLALPTFPIISGWNVNRLIHRPMKEITACQSNMLELYAAIKEYADMHDGLLPNGPRWCDDVLTATKISEMAFVCPATNVKEQSTYALNNCVAGRILADLSDETILFFESAPGWNQVGGIELVTCEYHSLANTRYFNAVSANGQVQHWPRNKAAELRWEP